MGDSDEDYHQKWDAERGPEHHQNIAFYIGDFAFKGCSIELQKGPECEYEDRHGEPGPGQVCQKWQGQSDNHPQNNNRRAMLSGYPQ
jgi:hypothetical protein